MKLLWTGLAFALLAFSQTAARYPSHWWTPVDDPHKPDWEILPQAAKSGEVILSKRNELGILSNFAATPFTYAGTHYASVEGFWQMMLYPEDSKDPRASAPGIGWRYTREQVSQMTSFQAKEAGTLAEDNMRRLRIDWVTFKGVRIPYRSMVKGEHYRLIREAMGAKLHQNPRVREILLSTGDLILRPDHTQEENAPPEWAYFQLWMDIRTELQKAATSSVDFSDTPTFVVAGVTDHSYVGGHGSDANVHSAASLSKATASLKDESASQQSPNSQSASSLVSQLARDPNNAALHHALADLEEKQGASPEATKEYQRAAELSPSENFLFDWGTELLSHGAAQAAAAVFAKGVSAFPASSRMLLGEGVSLFSQRNEKAAAEYFYKASRLNPTDPEPYVFLSKSTVPEVTRSDDYLASMRRFSELNAGSSQAHTCYAVALWNRRSGSENTDDSNRVLLLLNKAVKLDPNYVDAYLQLGIIRFDMQQIPAAIDAFKKAIQFDTGDAQAHYRLAACYRKLGQMQQAEQETATFHRLQQASNDQFAHQQNVIVTLKDTPRTH